MRTKFISWWNKDNADNSIRRISKYFVWIDGVILECKEGSDVWNVLGWCKRDRLSVWRCIFLSQRGATNIKQQPACSLWNPFWNASLKWKLLWSYSDMENLLWDDDFKLNLTGDERRDSPKEWEFKSRVFLPHQLECFQLWSVSDPIRFGTRWNGFVKCTW